MNVYSTLLTDGIRNEFMIMIMIEISRLSYLGCSTCLEYFLEQGSNGWPVGSVRVELQTSNGTSKMQDLLGKVCLFYFILAGPSLLSILRRERSRLCLERADI